MYSTMLLVNSFIKFIQKILEKKGNMYIYVVKREGCIVSNNVVILY